MNEVLIFHLNVSVSLTEITLQTCSLQPRFTIIYVQMHMNIEYAFGIKSHYAQSYGVVLEGF